MRRSCLGRRASAFSACLSASWNDGELARLLAAPVLRRGHQPAPCSHFATVLRDSPVMRADLALPTSSGGCATAESLPIMAMVITPLPLLPKKQQSRLNTRVSFGSAQPSKVGQFSVGANITGFREKLGVGDRYVTFRDLELYGSGANARM